MTAYALADGDELIVSIDGGEWETIAFARADFSDIGRAQPQEVADVCQRLNGLEARVADGDLVLATESLGGHAGVEVDLSRSTAAPALGLALGSAGARGAGLEAARVVSAAAEPYRLPGAATMTVIVDKSRRTVKFDSAITGGPASAAQVAVAINAKLRRKVARPSRDGKLMLTSPTVGLGSRLSVLPAPDGTPDAAVPLGFEGAAAASEPHPVAAAELTCSGRGVELRVLNLTAAPIEFLFPTGPAVLPSRGSLPLAGAEAAHEPLQRLIRDGAVALAAAPAPSRETHA